ncbi:MAG: nucleoside deaminase [Nanoarchaeota archaeon]|nr:nucleoside deaminase [Nanoarchaeota archaeon]
MNKFMKVAVKEAFEGLKKNDGGPFGAVIVKNGKIIAKSHNQVIKTNDPTAHAEVVALRKASARLKRFDLSDCEMYSSCEPCPMCFSAIHWAKMKKLFYGCTKEDAAKIGFDDKFIYDVIKGVSKKKQVKIMQIDREECLRPFKRWESKEEKVQY